MVNESLIEGATPDITYSVFSSEAWRRATTSVPKEMALTIYIDDEELVTILCTPTKLIPLVIGFLYSEGIIADKSDVASMRICEEESLADVRLSKPGYTLPSRRTISSGCGGGVSFAAERRKVDSSLVVEPGEVLSLMKQLNEQAGLYRFCGGVHTSALANSENLMVVAEDIGRIMGECLLTELPTRDRLLLTTGRISSEMLSKAVKMETPIVVSRSSPTDQSISLAQELGITLIGYVHSSSLSIYSHEGRVQGALEQG